MGLLALLLCFSLYTCGILALVLCFSLYMSGITCTSIMLLTLYMWYTHTGIMLLTAHEWDYLHFYYASHSTRGILALVLCSSLNMSGITYSFIMLLSLYMWYTHTGIMLLTVHEWDYLHFYYASHSIHVVYSHWYYAPHCI